MREQIINALKELRLQEKKNFDQKVDLVINLKKFDVKKETVNIQIPIPHVIKEYKIAAFLDGKSNAVDTITKEELKKLTEKKAIKNIAKKYDYFLSLASLMPELAKNLGKYLGPTGKMPVPGRGIIVSSDENTIKKELAKFQGTMKVKTKEPSIKLVIGKESMKNEEIAENIEAVYKAVLSSLSKGRDNIKNVMIKLTMSKPKKIAI